MIDRIPPQNIEAEQSVLGALLIDANAIEKVSGILKAEDFYRQDNRIIYEAMQPTTKDQLEAVRQEKANLFLKHKLKIDNIVNGTLEKNQTNQGLPGVESAANLEGNWQDLCSCLSEFVKANLCAITGLSIDGREGGNLKARLSYRIYYR